MPDEVEGGWPVAILIRNIIPSAFIVQEKLVKHGGMISETLVQNWGGRPAKQKLVNGGNQSAEPLNTVVYRFSTSF